MSLSQKEINTMAKWDVRDREVRVMLKEATERLRSLSDDLRFPGGMDLSNKARSIATDVERALDCFLEARQAESDKHL